jgi:outer membrane receptor for ferrienterochelin and colicin
MNERIMKRLILSLLAGVSLPLVSQSTGVGAELEDIISTDQLQAASKKVQDASSAPADVVVMRSGELQAMGYRTLGDAVAGVVGFRTNDDHAYQSLAVRGL